MLVYIIISNYTNGFKTCSLVASRNPFVKGEELVSVMDNVELALECDKKKETKKNKPQETKKKCPDVPKKIIGDLDIVFDFDM